MPAAIEERQESAASLQNQPAALSQFLQIRPGLMVAVSVAQDMGEAHVTHVFPGDCEYIHLNCILNGRFDAQVKDSALTCMAGDINMGFSAGETFYSRHCEHFKNVAVMIRPDVLYELAGEELAGLNFDKDLRFFIRNGLPCQRVSVSAARIETLIRGCPQKSLLLQSAILDYLYWHLNALQESDCCVQLSLREKKLLMAAREFLLSDLSAPPTIQTVAKKVGLNQCKLKKGFKVLFNATVYGCFQQERMHKAMDMLKNCNVTETAISLGYSNVSHFSSAFRKQFGILPKDVRQSF